MPAGLRVPIGVNKSGGLAFVEHDDQDQKVIKLALGSGDSENAFQQGEGLALGVDMIFDINDPTNRVRIRRLIVGIFADFETANRFKLLPDSLEFSEEGAEATLKLKYLNIESDEVNEFETRFLSR